ncbi:hypothetical protein YT1_p20042 (plasmid) [Rhodococcus ruber]|nr:hypothetical protein YT1_p20042 [Rhodococcus ruber]
MPDGEHSRTDNRDGTEGEAPRQPVQSTTRRKPEYFPYIAQREYQRPVAEDAYEYAGERTPPHLRQSELEPLIGHRDNVTDTLAHPARVNGT